MAACAATLDPVQTDAYLPAQKQLDSIISQLRSTARMTHSELEQFLNLDGREILRRIFQGYIDERGPVAVDLSWFDNEQVAITYTGMCHCVAAHHCEETSGFVTDQ